MDTSTWMRYLAEQDFSFGSRIHGNIVALSAGTPAYVLAHDSRTLELARYHDIPHSLVPDLTADVDAAELYEQADYTAFNAGQAERWDRFAGFLERSAVEHVFQPGNENPDYEAQLAAVDLPPAVTTLMTTDLEARERITARVAELYSLGGRRALRKAHEPVVPFPHTVAPAPGRVPGQHHRSGRRFKRLPAPVRAALRRGRSAVGRLLGRP